MPDAHVVDQEARLEVVRAVDDDVEPLQELHGVVRVQVGDDRLDGHRRIRGVKVSRRGDGLRDEGSNVLLREEELALEVGLFDHIAIDDADAPHAGAHQDRSAHGPERPAPHDDGGGAAETLLSFHADSLEEGLAGIPVACGGIGHAEPLGAGNRGGTGRLAGEPLRPPGAGTRSARRPFRRDS